VGAALFDRSWKNPEILAFSENTLQPLGEYDLPSVSRLVLPNFHSVRFFAPVVDIKLPT